MNRISKQKNKIVIPSQLSAVGEGIGLIEEALAAMKIRSKDRTQALLAAEDIIVKLIEKAAPGSDITVSVYGRFGSNNISFICAGSAFDITDITDSLYYDSASDDEETKNILAHLAEKVFGDKLSVKNDKGVNRVVYTVAESSYLPSLVILLSLVLGIAAGLVMKTALPAAAAAAITDNFLSPVYTIIMNAIKLIVAPLVFCSIASSIADFGDIRSLGKTAVKVVGMYLFTSLIAICVGLLAYTLFPIGNPVLASAVDASSVAGTVATAEGTSISVIDTIAGIVPTDIITPFIKSDMLQIIFLSFITGLMASAVSNSYPGFRKALETLNAGFSWITVKIMAFLPLMVFCSMAKMMIGLDFKHFAGVLAWLPVCYFGLAVMVCVYMVLLLVFAGLNPMQFFKKFYKATLAAITLNSSNAAVPTSVKQCDELGIPKSIYSFSVPLGATINMDGSCVVLMITSLYLAKIFGQQFSSGMLLSLFIAIMVLSVGCPGIPGGTIVTIALLIREIGVPAEAISLLVGISPLVTMFLTGANVTGDGVVSAILSKREGLLDLEKFNSD